MLILCRSPVDSHSTDVICTDWLRLHICMNVLCRHKNTLIAHIPTHSHKDYTHPYCSHTTLTRTAHIRIDCTHTTHKTHCTHNTHAHSRYTHLTHSQGLHAPPTDCTHTHHILLQPQLAGIRPGSDWGAQSAARGTSGSLCCRSQPCTV